MNIDFIQKRCVCGKLNLFSVHRLSYHWKSWIFMKCAFILIYSVILFFILLYSRIFCKPAEQVKLGYKWFLSRHTCFIDITKSFSFPKCKPRFFLIIKLNLKLHWWYCISSLSGLKRSFDTKGCSESVYTLF